MAKTRKAKTTKKTTNSIAVNSTKYQGKITVSLKHGKRVLSTKTYHNSGMPNLFKFIASAISGNSTTALRPTKIKLFKFPKADAANNTVLPKNFVWTDPDNWDPDNGGMVAISPYVLYSTTPIVKRVENEQFESNDDYHYEVIFYFNVPYTYISSTICHAVGFYPNNAISEIEDVSAFYLFSDESGDNWEPLDATDAVGNFSINITWTMSILNK